MRNHDEAADARLRGMGGGAVGEVAGAGTPDGVETKLDGLADGDGDHPLLVGIGWVVARVVLDPQLVAPQFVGKPVSPLQRGESGMMSCFGLPFDRQQIPIAPEIARAGGNRLACNLPLHFCIIVLNFVRAKTGLADMNRGDRHPMPAFLALESQHVTHRGSFNQKKSLFDKKRLGSRRKREAPSYLSGPTKRRNRPGGVST